MGQRFIRFVLLVLVLWQCVLGLGQGQQLDREFQQAVAQYNEGKFAEAAVRLEGLLNAAPESFEVHELLGLVYSAQSQDVKANPHLEKAVRLQPDSVPARSNLAANLARLGKPVLALEQFKKAAEIDPQNFDTNHNLGEFYIRAGQIGKAAPFLERAQKIDPSSYDNGYDLSLAYLLTGKTTDARQLVQDLLEEKIPRNYITCWLKFKRRMENSSLRPRSTKPPRTWNPVKTICLTGEASYFYMRPWTLRLKFFSRHPAVIHIRRVC